MGSAPPGLELFGTTLSPGIHHRIPGDAPPLELPVERGDELLECGRASGVGPDTRRPDAGRADIRSCTESRGPARVTPSGHDCSDAENRRPRRRITAGIAPVRAAGSHVSVITTIIGSSCRSTVRSRGTSLCSMSTAVKACDGVRPTANAVDAVTESTGRTRRDMDVEVGVVEANRTRFIHEIEARSKRGGGRSSSTSTPSDRSATDSRPSASSAVASPPHSPLRPLSEARASPTRSGTVLRSVSPRPCGDCCASPQWQRRSQRRFPPT
ncbi:MAG: hypothetical protein AVDCRST_MAG66-2599 [uncultured Pseudonocardia sp.]|uniref:Uncharacterized protein n=1 Tax=uncultured Pseudonocardia sp. TaxID=211455 RepID=A0A6J4PMQ9_9PSEU|nr:MAG: hypothetical protein AVDCRST_MAG66-2599 [uncultured Pseudonocardia sp.]